MSNLLTIKLFMRDARKRGIRYFPIRGKYRSGDGANLSLTVEKISDENGYVTLNLLPHAHYDISVMTTRGVFEHNATISTDIAARKSHVIIGLSNQLTDYISIRELRIVDLDDKPVAHCKFKMVYRGNTSFQTVGADGKKKIRSVVGESVTITVLKPDNTEVSSATFTYTSHKVKEANFRLIMPIHQNQPTTTPNQPTTPQPLTPPLQSCGINLRNQVKCTRYNHGTSQNPNFWYGPIYGGVLRISDFSDWATLISSNVLTLHEKNVICMMSPNEGKFDTVQSYDRVILTVGAMQKTIMDSAGSEGTGELSIQLNKFKTQYPALFQTYLGNCGWDVRTVNGVFIVSYEGHQDSALKNIIRTGCSHSSFGQTLASPAVESMANATSLKEYIKIQVEDFIERLRLALSKKPKKNQTRSYDYPISSYLKSALGHATVLDQDVNAPALVRRDFGKALNHFFELHPMVSQNPSDWGSQSTTYENEIVSYYGVHRSGTDMVHRFHNLQNVAG